MNNAKTTLLIFLVYDLADTWAVDYYLVLWTILSTAGNSPQRAGLGADWSQTRGWVHGGWAPRLRDCCPDPMRGPG